MMSFNDDLSTSLNQTFCEINGKLIDNDKNITQLIDNEVAAYPCIRVTSESLLKSTLLVNESAQSAFVEHSETLLQKLSVSWYSHGMVGVLSELSDSTTNEVSPQLKLACHYMLVALRFLSGMQLTIFPHLKLANEDLINVFSENNDWRGSPIRYLAWHHKANKLALALRDDTIRIYYSDNSLVPMLKHKLQRNISVMAWKPLSASVLAVGTQSVILIWTIDPNSLSNRPSSSAAQVLSYSGHNPITSLTWCPLGRNRLYAVSALNSALLVWNVSEKEYQIIQHITTSGGISRLSFSPDGSKVMAATPGSSFRIFEAATWTNERWSNLAGRVQSSCWGPDGTFLLFSLFGDPHVYSVTFPDSNSFDTPVIEGSKHASVILNLTPDDESGTSGSPSNYIHNMVLDESGERLAIMFSKSDPRHNLVGLYSVSAKPVLTITHSGYAKGNDLATPTLITFKPNYAKGALLTICYSDGVVRYIPLYFQPMPINSTLRTNFVSFDRTQPSFINSSQMWTSMS